MYTEANFVLMAPQNNIGFCVFLVVSRLQNVTSAQIRVVNTTFCGLHTLFGGFLSDIVRI